MTKLFLMMGMVGVAGLLLGGCACCEVEEEEGHSMSALGKVRHVVMFKFKDGTTKEQIAACERDFAGLKGKIPFIVDFEFGTNNSPEPHSKGYTHCFLVTFNTEKDRDAYLPHPAHKDFVKAHGPIIGEVHVLDYVARAK